MNKYKLARKVSLALLASVFISPTLSFADVINDSDHSIYVKPESSTKPVEVKKGEEYKGPQDGVAANGKVFKNIDGSDVEVDKHGTAKVIQKNPVRLLAEEVRGGYLEKSPDKGWDPVFAKAEKQAKQQSKKKISNG
ncbi:hypothetical protein [Vibrio porteresiae]|uniref:Uncharacterized protein n=1 Tax=Vibrio porteresiae DSM 19223 TaxID=1123496 RepID=A0ABZ0QKU9_9VIBR|nr:hypothetical protein [Vibrio porteresiae]WPC76053.1 hypothetical protein R8Z52_24385 [Vibrio porteresiae DSM 19223]